MTWALERMGLRFLGVGGTSAGSINALLLAGDATTAIRFVPDADWNGTIVNGITIHGGLRAFGATFLTFSDYMRPAVRLAALMDAHGLKPEFLSLEITESDVMEDLAKSLDILTRFRMKGFRLSIDDFGTGYSSLEKLARIPFTELKIDRSFVKHIDNDPTCQTIARLSVMLAHELDMTVVAEGIETEAAAARAELREQAQQLAGELATKILGREVRS